jgi:hypothetical protein
MPNAGGLEKKLRLGGREKGQKKIGLRRHRRWRQVCAIERLSGMGDPFGHARLCPETRMVATIRQRRPQELLRPSSPD